MITVFCLLKELNGNVEDIKKKNQRSFVEMKATIWKIFLNAVNRTIGIFKGTAIENIQIET